jgi:ATP-dependent Clp protease ATP-binding subunit ClpA
MDPQHWTERTSSAISAAADAAAVAGHPQIEPLHVALAALEDAAGVARAAVLRAGGGDEGAVASLRRTLARAAGRLPAVRPPPEGTPSASPSLVKVLRRGATRMKERGDTFLAVDTLWLACLEDPKVRSSDVLLVRAAAFSWRRRKCARRVSAATPRAKRPRARRATPHAAFAARSRPRWRTRRARLASTHFPLPSPRTNDADTAPPPVSSTRAHTAGG